MPWAIAVAAIGAYMDKESSIPEMSMGTIYSDTTRTPLKEKQCGWKCTGCHATNGAHESQCSWCRTYRLEENIADTAAQMKAQADLISAEMMHKMTVEELEMRKAYREALHKTSEGAHK